MYPGRLLARAMKLLRRRAPTALRAAEFEALGPESEVALACCGSETFVVLTGDTIISRTLYVQGNVFFARLEKALHLLGSGFQLETLVEVGANIGIICIPAVKRGLARRAIAIEPIPRNYQLLLTNIQLNGVSQLIETHAIALGANSEQTVEFELSPDNSGDHRVRTDAGEGLFSESSRQTIAVRSTRFDDVVPQLDPATALVWLEAQGFEGFILEGAKNAVDRRVPVMTEFCPYMVARAGAYEAFVSAALRYQQAFDLFDTRPEPFAVSRLALNGLRDRLGNRGAYTDLLLT